MSTCHRSHLNSSGFSQWSYSFVLFQVHFPLLFVQFRLLRAFLGNLIPSSFFKIRESSFIRHAKIDCDFNSDLYFHFSLGCKLRFIFLPILPRDHQQRLHFHVLLYCFQLSESCMIPLHS
jgi:hypothetical protein